MLETVGAMGSGVVGLCLVLDAELVLFLTTWVGLVGVGDSVSGVTGLFMGGKESKSFSGRASWVGLVTTGGDNSGVMGLAALGSLLLILLNLGTGDVLPADTVSLNVESLVNVSSHGLLADVGGVSIGTSSSLAESFLSSPCICFAL